MLTKYPQFIWTLISDVGEPSPIALSAEASRISSCKPLTLGALGFVGAISTRFYFLGCGQSDRVEQRCPPGCPATNRFLNTGCTSKKLVDTPYSSCGNTHYRLFYLLLWRLSYHGCWWRNPFREGMDS